MKFITHRKFPKNGGIDYAAFQREENSKYSITRLFDGKKQFRDRKPRRDSKFWDDGKFLIWDTENNCQAS